MAHVVLLAETGLSEASGFAITKELRLIGLIVGYRLRQRNAWYAADPATAWLSLAAEETWSVSSTLTHVSRLPKTGIAQVDTRSELLRQAAIPAVELWTGRVPSHEESRPAHNAEALAQLAIEAIRIAKFHIRSISASPKVSGAAKFWPPLVAQMDQGVRYTRVTDLDELYEHGLDIVRRDLESGVELFIGPQALLTRTRGYLADRKVLVRYKEAPVGERPIEGFMTSDRHAVDRYRRRFDQAMRASVPAGVAVQHLVGLADALRAKASSLSQDARDWLDDLVRLGRYSRLPTEASWAESHRHRVEQELLDSGLATRAIFGHLVPGWPDAEQVSASLRARHHG
ncbi:hypothetical protein ACWEOW_01110 [Monashia sp. NPDC004114]